MLSANSLLSRGNPKVAPNVGIELRDPMYNPTTPKIGDDNTKFVKDARSLRMKDRFYVDMTLNSYSKNGDGYTLGQNNKGFKAFTDYDRAIDPNLLIRRDPNSKQYYQPNDYYNGSYDSYYSLPKSIKRPAPTIGGDLLSEISALYNFKPASISTGFLNNIASGAINTPITSTTTDKNANDMSTATTSLSIPVPSPTRSPGVRSYASKQDITVLSNTAPIMQMGSSVRTPMRMNDVNTIGTNPTEDPDIIKAKDEYDKIMQDSTLERNRGRQDKDTVYSRYGMDTKLDQYGNPVIRTGTKIGLDDMGKFKSYGI
jgi:hypothetical protein